MNIKKPKISEADAFDLGVNSVLNSLTKQLSKIKAEINYWKNKAEQLAINNKKCLICLVGNMEVVEAMSCKKCVKVKETSHV